AVMDSRLVGFDLGTLLALIWTRTVFALLAGNRVAMMFADLVGSPSDMGLTITLLALIVTMILSIYLFVPGGLNFTKVVLPMGYLSVLLPTIIFSIGEKDVYMNLLSGGRYFFVPNVNLPIVLTSSE
ncbi:hypothetical protein HC928_21815, partial [bacterium]|nr:hypothetical protein [bacterium]